MEIVITKERKNKHMFVRYSGHLNIAICLGCFVRASGVGIAFCDKPGSMSCHCQGLFFPLILLH